MSGPRVSVVVCAYNAEATIAETLDSLLAQTSRDFDVVVVDDGSTDATVATVERVSRDAVVGVRVAGMEHAGLAAARNRGVHEANGDYVAFVDADDTVDPAMIEHMLQRADATGADIVVCDMLYVDFETGATMHVAHEGDISLYRGSLLDSPGLLSRLGGSACDKLFRRSLFESSGIRFPDGRIFEDLWTVYRLFAVAKLIAKVDEPLYCYRQARRGSIMSEYDDRYLEIVDGLAVTNDFYAEQGMFEPLREELAVLNFYHLVFGRYTNLLQFGPRDVRHRYLGRAFAHMDRYFPGWRRDPAVREICGGYVKTFVFTHRVLLTVFTDIRARGTKS